MDPLIVVFVMATGFVTLTIVLSLLLAWFTQVPTHGRPAPRPTQTNVNASYQVKSIPSSVRPSQNAYLTGASPAYANQPSYFVKSVPGTRRMRPSGRHLAVAS